MQLPGFSQKLHEQATSFVDLLANECTSTDEFGSFSSVAYDSAWVSMVQKKGSEVGDWRYPECFQHLLNTQQKDGGWYSGVRMNETDAILNSMAALLALKKHLAEPGNCALPSDLNGRIHNATFFLQSKLDSWDVEGSDHVGLELLVPALLQLLECEGVTFKVPGLQSLMALSKKKLAHFDPQLLYGPVKSTLIHSLEAFVGRIDFDKVSHHKVSGSMMASPASTAAYLMHASTWDEEAEHYLSRVILNGSGKGGGGVPSAFPTPIFELAWVLSTLLLADFTLDELGLQNVNKIGDFLHRHLHAGNNVLGFAPNLLPDADDTAKTILSLNLIGRNVSPVQMNADFETKTHFKTYAMERNPSFSANCNILCSLLFVANPNDYILQISKTASFICDCLWEDSVKDKWNAAPQYPLMLSSQALIRLLRLWDSKELANLPDQLVRERIPVVLHQMLVRTLQSQDVAGWWGDQSIETSAYAVLTLVHLWPLPWAISMRTEVETAITKGQLFLGQKHSTVQAEPIWTEKVSYSSSVLFEAYSLAAMNANVIDIPWGEAVLGLTDIVPSSVERFLQFFSQLPLFAKALRWRLQASLIEGYLFLPHLKQISRKIFPRDNMAEDKYLEYIPLTWTLINNLQQTQLSASFLREMMVISMLNYQVDEYMEAVVGKNHEENLEPVIEMIRSLFRNSSKQLDELYDHSVRDKSACNGMAMDENRSTSTNGYSALENEPRNAKRNSAEKSSIIADTENSNSASPNSVPNPSYTSANEVNLQTNSLEAASLNSLKNHLGQFVNHVLRHPKIAAASIGDQNHLRQETETFLLAHVLHIKDNSRFSRQNLPESTTAPFLSPESAYFRWVHTTSADHTSCPYSFAFSACLFGTGGHDCFSGAWSKYLAQDVCSHLAVMCRQYNDYGSVTRDRAERNLNSINFPEFHDMKVRTAGQWNAPQLGEEEEEEEEDMHRKEDELKSTLFQIAEFERECLTRSLQRLKDTIPARTANMLDLFIGVTDLYGQIYVARDIASRMR